MNEEIKTIRKNDTWELKCLLKEKKKIEIRWLYKVKKKAKRKIKKYKVRVVTKGYRQQHDTDCNEVFAPITHLESIRLIMFLVIQNN